MVRLRHWITAAATCILAVGCTDSNDDRVNREILLSTVWYGERFLPETEPDAVPDEETGPDECLFVFGEDGILSVFGLPEGTGSEPLDELRYIYTAGSGEMVIDSYGVFTVREISVERLLMEGVSGTLDLRFYADADIVPDEEPTAANRNAPPQRSSVSAP